MLCLEITRMKEKETLERKTKSIKGIKENVWNIRLCLVF
jgi:hypothetical protein